MFSGGLLPQIGQVGSRGLQFTGTGVCSMLFATASLPPCSRYCPHFQMPNSPIPPPGCGGGSLDIEGEFSVVEASLQAVQKLPSPSHRGSGTQDKYCGAKPSDGFSRLTSAHPGERHSVHHTAGEIMDVSTLLPGAVILYSGSTSSRMGMISQQIPPRAIASKASIMAAAGLKIQ